MLGSLAVGAALIGGLGRQLGQRFNAAGSRADVRLPAPAERLPALPTTVAVPVDGMTPFVTPNVSFYRVDTALTAPQVPTEGYTLTVKGMVDKELQLSYEDLLARDMIERDITLTCVSNQVGGGYVGNARWLGTRLDALLDDAGVQPGADQVVGRSIDGFECGFPVANAMDGRDAMVVVGMNGEPLPIEHGFPVRLLVPGLYGFVSATKWLTEIELTTFADFDHYWLRRGWAQQAPIKLMSRIDTPRGPVQDPRRADGRRRCGVGPDDRHRGGRGLDRRRRVATGRVGGRALERHLAAMGAPLGRHAGPSCHHGPCDRRDWRNPDRRARRTNPRRCVRTSPDRGDRRMTTSDRLVNILRKDPSP